MTSSGGFPAIRRRWLPAIARRLSKAVRNLGPTGRARIVTSADDPPPVEPIWPLPRRPGGLCDEEIRRAFAAHELWHYAYRFEGGLAFPARHRNPGRSTDDPERPLQRFRHFMPVLLAAEEGSLAGKRVLDIACNSGFWSFQCALLGADVVGFDARPELVAQAELVRSILGVENVRFQVLDFWDMSPEALGGQFDVVLSLGILYHLPKPLEALELTLGMARRHVLLDTSVHPSPEPLVLLAWEEPVDIRDATRAGVVAHPSRSGIDLMLRHLKAASWREVPLRTAEMPPAYLRRRRTSWLISVRERSGPSASS